MSVVLILAIYAVVVAILGVSVATVVVAAVFAAVTIAAVLRNYTAAGDGWLRRGLVFGAPWVDLGELVACKLRVTPSGQTVELRDSSGRRVNVKLADLRRDPAMLEAVLSDVQAAEHAGRLSLDKTTQHYLALARG